MIKQLSWKLVVERHVETVGRCDIGTKRERHTNYRRTKWATKADVRQRVEFDVETNSESIYLVMLNRDVDVFISIKT